MTALAKTDSSKVVAAIWLDSTASSLIWSETITAPLKESATIPVKNGKYPCYIHSYSQKDEYDDYEYNNVLVTIEGIENCYLNRDKNGDIFFDDNSFFVSTDDLTILEIKFLNFR